MASHWLGTVCLSCQTQAPNPVSVSCWRSQVASWLGLLVYHAKHRLQVGHHAIFFACAGAPRESSRAGSSRGSRRAGRGGRPQTASAAEQVPEPPPAQAASGTLSAAGGTATTSKNLRSPDNAREIMLEYERQYWSAARQASVVYAHDGAKNLITPTVPPLLSGVPDVPSTFVVRDVVTPGQDRATSWQV